MTLGLGGTLDAPGTAVASTFGGTSSTPAPAPSGFGSALPTTAGTAFTLGVALERKEPGGFGGTPALAAATKGTPASACW